MRRGRGGGLPALPALPPRDRARRRHWSTQDASRILALQAARLIDEPDAWSDEGPGAARIALRMGVSDRHLRRIFEAQFGVSPLQYLQTRRLLAAKQLIADTRLPMTQVALASGFASVRRFNAAFLAHYGLNPSALRRAGEPSSGREGGADRRAAGPATAIRQRRHAGLLRAPRDRRRRIAVGRGRSGATYARTLRIVQGGRPASAGCGFVSTRRATRCSCK